MEVFHFDISQPLICSFADKKVSSPPREEQCKTLSPSFEAGVDPDVKPGLSVSGLSDPDSGLGVGEAGEGAGEGKDKLIPRFDGKAPVSLGGINRV